MLIKNFQACAEWYSHCYVANHLYTYAQGHGYLLKPPARGTAWRAGFDTPTDTNDMGNYCGGRGVSSKILHGLKIEIG